MYAGRVLRERGLEDRWKHTAQARLGQDVLERRLSTRAGLVLDVLGWHADVRGVAHPGYREIARLTGINRSAIRGLIDELERAGRIEVLGRGRDGTRYRVIERPARADVVVDPPSSRRLRFLPALLVSLLVLSAFIAAEVVLFRSGLFPYFVYVGISLLLAVISGTTLVWMMDSWRTPDSLAESRLSDVGIPPKFSFSLIVPARHEEGVLEATLSRLLSSDHPDFEVLVVVGHDDPGTRAIAEGVADRHPELVKVVIDSNWPKNKPKALNAALPYCTGEITGVFDAEDDVHPALLRRIDQRFQRTDADVVQAGVQLMNFRSSWLTVRNVLEYYFWFRSRLHLHARQGFIPLGGNTVFIRTRVLKAVSGWDPECLAEDCELGVRLSALGARTVAAYEPELVTREECPPTLRAFARQRTRWNQGYMQTLSRRYWRRLPRRQRALGVYILTMPCLQAVGWVLIPVSLITLIALKAPVPITLISFLPALPMLSTLAMELIGLGQFCRLYGERASRRDYARLIVGLPAYQFVLTFSAARAVLREARGDRGWDKTAHLGLHLRQEQIATDAEQVGGRRPASPPTRRFKPVGAAASAVLARARERPVVGSLLGPSDAPGLLADSLGADRINGGDPAGNGHRDWPPGLTDRLSATKGDEPLWKRLHLLSGNGAASPSPPSMPLVDSAATHGPPDLAPKILDGGAALLGLLRGFLRKLVTSHPDALLQVGVLTAVGAVVGANMLHWPETQFDEGTYVANSWAVQHGALSHYTYTYGHPPIAWLLIAAWTWLGGIFGHGTNSVDMARALMFVVTIVSCSLLYTLARRLDMSRTFAAFAVVLFALCPVSLYFHRLVFLDNVAIAWALAAFVLAMTPRRRLWAFAGSGACFAVAVLSKETTLILLPALLVAAAQNSDRRTRRYCLTLFGSFLFLISAAYPLYATLKGELLAGPGHVSLMGTTMFQLFERETTGSIFDPQSPAHETVMSWLRSDPWLLGASLILVPIALARRSTRAVTLALVIQVVMVLRPGYLPGMYVIGLLPFAALIVAGGSEVLWRGSKAVRLPAARWSMKAAIAAGAVIATLVVAPRWADGIQEATSVRLDGPERAAQRWLVDNVGRDQRVLVDDAYWIYLVEHGFDDQPVPGGFFSRTLAAYWPFDYDPAVKRHFPRGWRDLDYVVSTHAMRGTLDRTPLTAQALEHSRVVIRFGGEDNMVETMVEIRAITRGNTVPRDGPPGSL